MKLSLAEWCYAEHVRGSMESFYARAGAAGYTGTELVDESRWDLVRQAGLSLTALMGPGAESGLNTHAGHETVVPGIRESIETASANGIENVIVFSGNRVSDDQEASIAACVEGLRQVAPDAERAGVTLLFEMFNENDHPGYDAISSAYGFAVARGAASSAVKVLYDIYHMHVMGERVIEDIVSNLDIIGHLHVAGSPGRGYPGEGQEIDYPIIVREVVGAGYEGFWGMEFLPEGDPNDELERAAGEFGRNG